MKSAAIAKSPMVDLLEDEPLEIELATTLLYEHCHYSYRQLRTAIESLTGRSTQRNHCARHGASRIA